MTIPVAKGFELKISEESLRAAMLVSILSVWVLIGLFTYLNRYTKRRYFTLWTVAWLFYALWLSLNYGLLKFPETPLVMMCKEWCVGVAATFLLWGGFRFLRLRTRQSLLGWFIGFLLVWSYIGSYYLEKQLYVQLPIFGLIGMGSILVSVCFFQYRRRKQFIGASLLAFGFLLWGAYFASYPFFQITDDLAASGFFISAVLQLFIAVSMIILVLEEVRHTNQFALQQIRSQKTEKEVLKTKVVSAEERYRDLFDQATEAIVIASAENFKILELNAAAQRLLGITRKEAGEHLLPTFFHASYSQCIPPKGGIEWFNWACSQPHLKLVGKNGSVSAVEASGTPIEFDNRLAYQLFFRPMTERAQLEQQLRQAEKLSALGQMISGVAHELNNPLAVVKGYLELVLAHHEIPAQTRADLQKVAQESTRAAKLVKNFLAFAREHSSQREMINLNEIVERVAELRKIDLGRDHIELTCELASGLPETEADPDQVQQVINNLITNSEQAMEKHPKPHRIRISTQRAGDMLRLLVEDNGPGVPPALEQKIFEPFFTTKAPGVGTGLGLSLAHSIMTEHRGRIFYNPSQLGGAAFILEFPIVKAAQTASKRSTNPPPAMQPSTSRPATASARILVLDDEETLGEMLSEMLGMLGHKPTACIDPAKALELIEKQEFDLIISDFRMPVMNGQEFHKRVLVKNPALARRIIFLTGDVVAEETRTFLESNGNPHITKPFQLSTIEQVIGESLAKVEKV